MKVLTQHWGLYIFDPNLGKNTALFRVYYNISERKVTGADAVQKLKSYIFVLYLPLNIVP